ncbi:MAG: hypothetical protein WCL25_01705 [bacterium]
MRNNYRLFCIDASSGEELWSFKDRGSNGQEFYQTFKHISHGSYGYQFTVENDILFTELDRKIIAVRLSELYAPQLLWGSLGWENITYAQGR